MFRHAVGVFVLVDHGLGHRVTQRDDVSIRLCSFIPVVDENSVSYRDAVCDGHHFAV